MADRQRRHRAVGPCENRSFWSLVGRHAANARRARSSPAWQPSEKLPVSDRRQRYRTVPGFEDSPLPAALRTPGLRSVSKSGELQRELVRKAHGKRLNQNFRSQVLLVTADTVVGKAARMTRDPAATFRTTLLDAAAGALGRMRRCARPSRHSSSRRDFRILRMLSQDEMLPLTVNPDNTQTGHIEIRQLGIVLLPHPRFRNGNSIKEAIRIMKPKQIFISILAVLFVFPLMGTFAQQAANSGSIEVIVTFDYPGAGNSTLPQKINERG